ncbi:IscS subfamily cysteine desulfurase [Candidatus Erwinia haradaeae]|uniref:cysteine desulfurase n=1 Tax=Candidatus Erwinia haradaeae TaxID=1922217 RepID=A0A451D1N7_9GAMM|nr:IscS subfamily cysteine desulfurase [Candidatus Erwinia haradaeae]VFP79520.1 Cysteine desulfurase IscS [Candidatus Erwinia haradaeae]
MKLPIYLDYSATTPTDQRVVDKMLQYLTINGDFGNPASRGHRFGWLAEEAVDVARNQIAELIGCQSHEIIFTSGATESNNLAIKGAAIFYKKKGRHIITLSTEHISVLDTCRQLKKEGFKITYLQPNNDGSISLHQIEQEINRDTLLVSIMHVNNEIGIIQDIVSIGELCKKLGVLFHVDATQSVGKLPIDLKKLKIDLMSFSAHKIYGPKGIGALFVRSQPRIYLSKQMHGGSHERNMRSGTLPVHQIVGMGEAWYIAQKTMMQDAIHLHSLRQKLWNGIKHIDKLSINGSLSKGVSHILNVSFHDINHDTLMLKFKDIAISTGSACSSTNTESSYVLQAIGVSSKLAYSSIRFSFGRFTTEKEITYVVHLINNIMNY